MGLIGPYDMLPVAREAVEMLINGSFHKTVWNYLYAYRRKMKKEKGELWYEPARKKGEQLDVANRIPVHQPIRLLL